MANFLINPVVPGFTSDTFASKVKPVSSQEGASFASYIEEKSAELDHGRNMLGLQKKQAATSESVNREDRSPDESAASSVAELLEQFMAQLNELAGKKDIGAGEWQLSGLDSLDMERLAEKAGMRASELAALLSKAGDGGTTLGLVDFFSALESTFAEVDRYEPVMALETSLPLLQTILSKFGVSESDIAKISASSVDDFGGFDLNVFLDGLNSLDVALSTEAFPQGQGAVVPLSAWQAEQLQDMLATAGMTKETELQLFPEKSFEIFNGLKESLDNSDSTVQMDLNRLKSMLQQTINDSESAQPKVDLPAFLVELKNVLGQAEFKDGGVGWSPVVQNSIASVFEELQKIVDFSQIKVESRDGGYSSIWDEKLGALVNAGETGESQQLGKASLRAGTFAPLSRVVVGEGTSPKLVDSQRNGFGKMVVSDANQFGTEVGAKASVENATELSAVTVAGGKKTEAEFAAFQNAPVIGEDLTKNSSQKNLQHEVNLSMSHLAVDEMPDADIAKATNRPHSPTRPPLAQLPFEQISTGVLRGLNDSQRQLTLTLYPKELGEVKVDMLLRDNQLSLSFLMETPKVKELLESNMQEFRQNMSQNGFELGQCSVSVDQNNDSELSKHQFATGGHNINERARQAGLTEVNDIVAAGQELRASYHDSQISVIA